MYLLSDLRLFAIYEYWHGEDTNPYRKGRLATLRLQLQLFGSRSVGEVKSWEFEGNHLDYNAVDLFLCRESHIPDI